MIEQQLKLEEGFRSTPYYDILGKLTTGYGHCIVTNPLSKAQIKKICGKSLSQDNATEWLYTHGISKDNAEWLLRQDILDVTGKLLAKYPWMQDMDQARFDAILSMAFQMGVGKIGHFKHMLKALEIGDYEEAGKQALDSKWAEQTPARAERVSEQLRTGIYG